MRHKPVPGAVADQDRQPGGRATVAVSAVIACAAMGLAGLVPTAVAAVVARRPAAPASPHQADQTALFSRRQWLPDRFCAAQIAADPHLTVTTIRS